MMLQIKALEFLILFVFMCYSIDADCGCNKLKRDGDASIASKYERYADNARESCPIGSRMVGGVCEPDADTTFKKILRDHQHTALDNVDDMSLIPGGRISIGTENAVFAEDKESPPRQFTVRDFYLDKFETSNALFQEFVEATGYKTDAESYGDSFIFKGLITDEIQKKYENFRVVNAVWWYKIEKVDWRHPEGVNSTIDDRWDHPVVHVSWNDAVAFCDWAGKRLPTEPEWETACHGGKKDKLFPWGNKLMPHGEHWMNIWQGDEFPDNDLGEDGSVSTCAVTKFRQNDYDLHNMVGNVWEWTADRWDGAATDKDDEKPLEAQRVKKGGSYLCHKSYCYRYRCAARSQNTIDSSAGNLGFRCAKNA